MFWFISAAALASAPAPADGLDVSLPAEIAAHTPDKLRSYFLVFVVTPDKPKPMTSDLFVRHQAYIRKPVEAGYIRLVGPINGSDHLRGMKVISAESVEDARAIAEGDPAVQEHVLDVEVYPVTLPSLGGMKIEYPAKP